MEEKPILALDSGDLVHPRGEGKAQCFCPWLWECETGAAHIMTEHNTESSIETRGWTTTFRVLPRQAVYQLGRTS